MKQEVTFYQVDELISKSFAPLVQKALSEKKRVLIVCADRKLLDEIDASIWSYGRSTFIPHVTIFDREFDHATQPVVISDKYENHNSADYLIFVGDAPAQDFCNKFSRIFYLFDVRELNAAKEVAKKLSPSTFYKKEDGKWVAAKF
jgi:DNA polymerase-3 subunit chi